MRAAIGESGSMVVLCFAQTCPGALRGRRGAHVGPEAADFWRRRGFVESRDDPLILFSSIAAIAASLTGV